MNICYLLYTKNPRTIANIMTKTPNTIPMIRPLLFEDSSSLVTGDLVFLPGVGNDGLIGYRSSTGSRFLTSSSIERAYGRGSGEMMDKKLVIYPVSHDAAVILHALLKIGLLFFRPLRDVWVQTHSWNQTSSLDTISRCV